MKRFLVAVLGTSVLLIGIAMIVLPGPAVLVIPAGLAILATEYLWARRALRWTRRRFARMRRWGRNLIGRRRKPLLTPLKAGDDVTL